MSLLLQIPVLLLGGGAPHPSAALVSTPQVLPVHGPPNQTGGAKVVARSVLPFQVELESTTTAGAAEAATPRGVASMDLPFLQPKYFHLHYFRQKGGECIDPWAPNFDWNYWKFDFCYLPSFVNCYARPGRKCYCCGWSTCKYGSAICAPNLF